MKLGFLRIFAEAQFQEIEQNSEYDFYDNV